MSYRIKETGEVVSQGELRKRNPEVSLPAIFDADTLDFLGIEVVFEVPLPVVGEFETAIIDGTEKDSKGNWVFKYSVKPMFEEYTQEDGTVVSVGEQQIAYTASKKKAMVPSSISMRQARLALLEVGLLSSVDTAIGSLDSPAKERASIEWEYATEVDRTNPLVLSLLPVLGLSEDAIDDLFISAAVK
jgi:hypothetical protein